MKIKKGKEHKRRKAPHRDSVQNLYGILLFFTVILKFVNTVPRKELDAGCAQRAVVSKAERAFCTEEV